jgi:general secretion pathway protein B
MSYILEALKKAQAERQLGEAPSIHAAQVVAAPGSRPAARGRPLLVVVAAGVVAAGVAAALVWRQQAPRQVASVEAPGANAHATSAPPAVAPITITPSAPAPAINVAPVPAPAPAAVHRPAPVPATVTRKEVARASASVQASAAPAPEEHVRTLAELPDSIRREVPKVSFGGYMYSPDPADRLVLVDKTLRHEGEEVAPGLRLEKLLPKSAVLNYKGYVFRVGL